VKTAGDDFAKEMFSGVQGFVMNPQFNLPPGLTSVGASFAEGMFFNFLSLTMSPVFNLPQGVTSVGENFAATMFYRCGWLYTNTVFKFKSVSGSNAYYRTFYEVKGSESDGRVSRTATSIIAGVPTPSTRRETFYSTRDAWSDYASLSANWKLGATE
jgi:hypothetical protein